MTCTTDIRVRAIQTRTRQYRVRSEARQLSGLTACSLLLLTGIGWLLHGVQSPGVAAVADGFGAVLLRDGTDAYVVIGLAAFAAGVAATVLCMRTKQRTNRRADQVDASED